MYSKIDELYHFGTKGMKWGVRHDPKVGAARTAYKKSKQNVRFARKELSKSGFGFGIKALSRYNAAEKKLDSARMKQMEAKANYKASKAKNSNKASNAEFKTYVKEMQKTGLVGSASDSQNNGLSTKKYNYIKAKKGKDYADRVQKKVQSRIIKQVAGGAAVIVGANIATHMLERTLSRKAANQFIKGFMY